MKTYRFIVDVKAEDVNDIESVTVARQEIPVSNWHAFADKSKHDVEGVYEKCAFQIVEVVNKQDMN